MTILHYIGREPETDTWHISDRRKGNHPKGECKQRIECTFLQMKNDEIYPWTDNG